MGGVERINQKILVIFGSVFYLFHWFRIRLSICIFYWCHFHKLKKNDKKSAQKNKKLNNFINFWISTQWCFCVENTLLHQNNNLWKSRTRIVPLAGRFGRDRNLCWKKPYFWTSAQGRFDKFLTKKIKVGQIWPPAQWWPFTYFDFFVNRLLILLLNCLFYC